MKKGNHYIENSKGDLLTVSLMQKELLHKAFIVYPETSRDYLIDRIRTEYSWVDQAKLNYFDFRLRTVKVTTIMPEEYMVDYYVSIEEAAKKHPVNKVQTLSSEEFNEVNKKFLLVQKNKFIKGENITHL